MPETIRCLHCDVPLRLPEHFIGKEVRCPSCQKAFTARLPATAPAPRTKPEPEPERDEDRPSARKRPPDEDDRPSRRRPRDDDDDDRPSRREPRDDDDDDDYPRSRRPRYDRPSRSYAKGDRGGVIMALGIISLVFVLVSCVGAAIVGIVPIGVVGIGTGVAAWLLGRKDLAEIRNGERDPSGQGMVNAGWICGIIGTIINGIIVLIQCGFIALIAALFLAAAAGGAN
jgi:hypothetical protein